jgi:NAD(P)-dependent dehydrogenase (short-subunit alcohol dehydrogenase family)
LDLNGKAAIVSGGASGLGRATAQALVEAGAKVAVFDIDAEALAAVQRELGVLAVACDVADAASAEAAFAQARVAHGAERLLVNCAGIAPAARIVGRNGPMALDAFSRVIGVNLVGSFNLLRLSAAQMKLLDPLADGERGLIVLTASIAAYEGQIGQAAYAASKAGVVGLVLPAARELANVGVRVMGIAPGVFETPMVAAMPAEVQASLGASIPFPSRLGRASEYASLAVYLAGNAMLNGEVIRLDGAHRMGAR